VLLYYITDRKQFAGTEVLRCRELLRKIGEAARLGVDFIQLREKDLPAQELEKLATIGDLLDLLVARLSTPPGTAAA